MRMITAETITRGAYTGHSPIASGLTEALTMPDVTSIVFVVDDDVSVRESLELLIKSAGWRSETFDVTLPGLNGLALQQQLADRTDMPIIFITGHGDIPMTVQAMKAGAVEFLTKPLKHEAVLEAIGAAIERSRVAFRHAAEMRVLRTSYASLTAREREVMALVVLGLLNKQIAGELGISEITVKAHRGQVMRKMKSDSLPALVSMASRLGVPTAPTV